MSGPDESEMAAIAPNIRTLQIIAISLVLGVSIFLVVTVTILRSGKLLAPDPWRVDPKTPISLAAIIMAPVIVPVAFLLSRRITNQARRMLARAKIPGPAADDRSVLPPGELGSLVAIYQGQMIVGLALLEGVAFLATNAFLMEGKALTLVLAFGVIALMLARFPSRSRIESWLEEQRRLLVDDRLGG